MLPIGTEAFTAVEEAIDRHRRHAAIARGDDRLLERSIANIAHGPNTLNTGRHQIIDLHPTVIQKFVLTNSLVGTVATLLTNLAHGDRWRADL